MKNHDVIVCIIYLTGYSLLVEAPGQLWLLVA